VILVERRDEEGISTRVTIGQNPEIIFRVVWIEGYVDGF